MADHVVVGKVGVMTDPVAPGTMGSVRIPIRGGTEEYYATSPDETIPAGTQVLVMELLPPRTVTVSRLV